VSVDILSVLKNAKYIMTHILASAIIMLAAFALPGYTHPRPSIFNNLFTFFQLILELDKV